MGRPNKGQSSPDKRIKPYENCQGIINLLSLRGL
jgi:hypothetical protein